MMISKFINGRKRIHNISFHNILCIREDEIGDFCYSLHVFKSLKNQFPDSKITLLCKPFVIPLAKNDPFLNHVTSDWDDLTGNYDLIVDLRGSWKSNWYALHHPPKFRFDRGSVRFQNKLRGVHPHELITNSQVIESLVEEKNMESMAPISLGKEEINSATAYLHSNKIQSFAILHAGARRLLRRWPLENFAALATYLKNKKNLDIVICGDQGDVPEAERLQNMLPFHMYSVAGKFSLPEFAALVSMATVFIGNESGPLHIASVAGTPSLGLFGPGEPHVFYPKGKRSAFLHVVLECNPCNQVHCVHPDNPCIQRITIEEVKSKIDTLLNPSQ